MMLTVALAVSLVAAEAMKENRGQTGCASFVSQ